MNLDHIFYINLSRRPDRDQHVRAELDKHNLLNITERISAVDGSTLNLDTIPETIITSQGIVNAKSKTNGVGIPLTPGAIGCALSHRNIWLRIRDDPSIQSALILEDDIDLDKDFLSKLKLYQEEVSANNNYNHESYDVLFLGYHPATMKYFYSNLNTQLNSDMFVTTSKVYGLFGYIVTKSGAKKLLKIFPITEQVDTELYKSFQKFGVNAILVKPDLRIVTSEPSDIATTFGTDIQIRNNSIPNHLLSVAEIKETFQFATDYLQPGSIVANMLHLIIIIALALMITLVVDYISNKYISNKYNSKI